MHAVHNEERACRTLRGLSDERLKGRAGLAGSASTAWWCRQNCAQPPLHSISVVHPIAPLLLCLPPLPMPCPSLQGPCTLHVKHSLSLKKQHALSGVLCRSLAAWRLVASIGIPRKGIRVVKRANGVCSATEGAGQMPAQQEKGERPRLKGAVGKQAACLACDALKERGHKQATGQREERPRMKGPPRGG